MKRVIVHHNGDNDGLMSGLLATTRFQKEIVSGDAIVFGYNYEEKHPWMDFVLENINDDITIDFIDISPTLDFLRKEEVVSALENGNLSITLYDHHELKHDDILNMKLPNVEYRNYTNKDCGSLIYFNSWKEDCGGNLGKDIKDLKLLSVLEAYIKIVDSYDTWKFSLAQRVEDKILVLAFNEKVGLSRTVEEFYNSIMVNSYLSIINEGITILRYKIREELNSMLRNALISNIPENGIDNVTSLPVLLLQGRTSYFSEIFVKETLKDKKFVIFYYNINFNEGIVKLSIRASVPGTFDCAKVARQFDPNGGGHRDAAGASLSIGQFFEILSRSIKDSLEMNNKKLLTDLSNLGFENPLIKELNII